MNKVWSIIFGTLQLLAALGMIGIAAYYLNTLPSFEDRYHEIFHVILAAVVIVNGVEWIDLDFIKNVRG